MGLNTLLSKEQWILTGSTGLFLFFVLYFYEGFGIPKGLSATGHSLLFRSICFGLLAGTVIFLNEYFLRSKFTIRNNIHLIFWYLWELILVWHATYVLINYFWGWDQFSWFGYFDLLGELSSVMIVPFAITEVYKSIQKAKTGYEPKAHKLIIESENGRERVSIAQNDFLYITSQDNYVDVYFLENDQVKHKTLRSTLKDIEAAYSDSPYLIRCHRSYIINPSRIIHLSESSRKNRAELPFNIKIPVSGKYLSEVKKKLTSSD